MYKVAYENKWNKKAIEEVLAQPHLMQVDDFKKEEEDEENEGNDEDEENEDDEDGEDDEDDEEDEEEEVCNYCDDMFEDPDDKFSLGCGHTYHKWDYEEIAIELAFDDDKIPYCY
jgi:hypothetical protein